MVISLCFKPYYQINPKEEVHIIEAIKKKTLSSLDSSYYDCSLSWVVWFHKKPDPYLLAYPLFRFILREPLALPRLPGRLAQPTGRLLWIPASQEPEGKIKTRAGRP